MRAHEWAEERTAEQWAALAEQLREEARSNRRASAESWERSDTDGFLSQWASDEMARRYSYLASVADEQGMLEEPVLFRDGKPVPTKLVPTQYGDSYVELESWDMDSRIVAWVGQSVAQSEARRQAFYAKKGYTLGLVLMRSQLNGKTQELYTKHEGEPQNIVTTDLFAQLLAEAVAS
jgi:hypothetical protein